MTLGDLIQVVVTIEKLPLWPCAEEVEGDSRLVPKPPLEPRDKYDTEWAAWAKRKQEICAEVYRRRLGTLPASELADVIFVLCGFACQVRETQAIGPQRVRD